MGQIDIVNLFKIYDEIKSIKKKHKLSFNFKIDSGSYETAIEFVGVNHFHPPLSKDWSDNPIIFCPDLLDYHNHIIIEYEEEIGNKRPGAYLAKKGHNRFGDIANKKDERRNNYYEKGGFSLLQIWEDEINWQEKLETFLLNINLNNY